VIGLGLSFEYTAAPMLVAPLAHPTHRAQLSTLLNTLYNFGVSLTGRRLRGRRIICIMGVGNIGKQLFPVLRPDFADEIRQHWPRGSLLEHFRSSPIGVSAAYP